METEKIVHLIDDKLTSAFDALQGVLIKYGPEVADTALMIVRIDSLKEIIIGVLMILIFIPTYMYFKACVKAHKSEDTRFFVDEYNDPTVISVIIGGGLIITNTFAIATFFTKFFDIWNWVGIFYPKLYLAKQILSKVIN